MTSEKALEIRAFYSGLLEAYAFLSDEQIGVAMRNEAIEQKKKSWDDFGRHTEYMRAALAGSKLSEERKSAISTRLDVQKEEYEETYYQPEARGIVGKGDKEALVARRAQLANGLYYDDEKISWKECEARGEVKSWRDIPKRLVQKIDRELEVLPSQQNPPYSSPFSSTKQARLRSRLTPAQEYKNFTHRCDEFSNLLNISYSTANDDEHITVYNSADPPQESGLSGLWCPMTTGEQAHTSSLWLEFSQQERNAIRLGHARGLCRITGGSIASDSMDGELSLWRDAHDEIFPTLSRKFKEIEKRAYRTRQFALEQIELEKLLQIIYDAGKDVPHHPDFGQDFLAQLEQLPLDEVDAFLERFCDRKGIGTPHGYSYLLDLITDATQRNTLTSRAAVSRALGWLHTAILHVNTEPSSQSAPPFAQAVSTPPPCSLSTEELDEIAIKSSLVKPGKPIPTRISGTTAAALWGMVEMLEAATLIEARGRRKLALWLARRYNVKMREGFDGPGKYSLVRTNAWRDCGNALKEVVDISEPQRKAAMKVLNSKKIKRLGTKAG